MHVALLQRAAPFYPGTSAAACLWAHAFAYRRLDVRGHMPRAYPCIRSRKVLLFFDHLISLVTNSSPMESVSNEMKQINVGAHFKWETTPLERQSIVILLLGSRHYGNFLDRSLRVFGGGYVAGRPFSCLSPNFHKFPLLPLRKSLHS